MKWTVEWVDGNGKTWHTRNPLGQSQAARKAQHLMRRRPRSQKHATRIHLYPGSYEHPDAKALNPS